MFDLTRTQLVQRIKAVHKALSEADPEKDMDEVIDLTYDLKLLTEVYDEQMWNAEWRNS